MATAFVHAGRAPVRFRWAYCISVMKSNTGRYLSRHRGSRNLLAKATRIVRQWYLLRVVHVRHTGLIKTLNNATWRFVESGHYFLCTCHSLSRIHSWLHLPLTSHHWGGAGQQAKVCCRIIRLVKRPFMYLSTPATRISDNFPSFPHRGLQTDMAGS